MNFHIADTFTSSLAKLTGDEQKAVKQTAFDLQINPPSPGMSFHKLDRAKDKSFWSVRVSKDIRLIVHRTETSLLLCYVGHHDDAYGWARRRKIERHPVTGAAQIVEIRELVREVEVPKYVEVEQARRELPPLFADVSEDTLLAWGVPEEWLADVQAASEESLFDLLDHLPEEAAEALLEAAAGGPPAVVESRASVESVAAEPEYPDEEGLVATLTAPELEEDLAEALAHPDARRRFQLVTSSAELEQALSFPWEKWIVFLHPDQRDLVQRTYRGPARASGSAGTGKTVVALHRAAHLAERNPAAKVLLTTFSAPLAALLRQKLERLVTDPKALARISVRAIDEVAVELHEAAAGPAKIADEQTVRRLLGESAAEAGEHRFTERFLWAEWRDVVDAWQLQTWEEYRDVARLGRKTRLGEKQRSLLWSIFERVRARLAAEGLVTLPAIFARLASELEGAAAPPYDFAVVDEAQDISVPQLRFLAALGGGREDSLFFAGDLGQRIFQTPFSWKSLGVDVRGRSHTLRVNYRTSHQIRRQADRLLAGESVEEEAASVAAWLAERAAEGVEPHEVGVFVRSDAELPRARQAIEAAGLRPMLLDGGGLPREGAVAISTMHLAKGLEFRAVAVMACDDEVVPLQARIESVADDADLEDVYDTERHLLYVACTRARERLLMTGVEPVSEFLDDLRER